MSIFNERALEMLKAIKKYSQNEICQQRAEFYLDDRQTDDYKKLSIIKGEGGFMRAVIAGDLELAFKRADSLNTNALNLGLKFKEITL